MYFVYRCSILYIVQPLIVKCPTCSFAIIEPSYSYLVVLYNTYYTDLLKHILYKIKKELRLGRRNHRKKCESTAFEHILSSYLADNIT